MLVVILLQFKLTDYKVEIRGQGTDTNVYVEMKLQQASHNSIGSGTSPDIIQASIEALPKLITVLINNLLK